MDIVQQLFGKRFKVNYRDPIRVFRQKTLRAQGLAVAAHALESNASIAGVTTLLATALIVLLLILSSGHIPSISGISSEDVLRNLTISSNQKSSRELALSRINQEQERKFASQIHFITEIIMTHRSKAVVMTKGDAFRVSQSIVSESLRSGFDPLFIASIIKAESTFNPHAKSSAGAIGLMQMLPSTGAFIAGKNSNFDVRDPAHNIRLGILYLAYLRKIFHGDREKMLIAYNWGPENMRQALRSARVVPSSPIHYARKVISIYNDWALTFDAQASRYRHLDFERAAVESGASSHLG